MRIQFIIILTMFIPPLAAQWLSFDLSKANQTIFLKQVDPIIRSSVLSFGHPTRMKLSENRRIGIGLYFPLGWDGTHESMETNPHYFPLLAEGQILVSNRLVFKGKMNLVSPNNTTINIGGYGIEYFKDSWSTFLQIGWLEGMTDLRIRMVDFSFLWERTVSGFPINVGFGTDHYKVHFNNIDDNITPAHLEDALSYLILGTRYQFRMFDLNMQTQLTPGFIQLNVQFLKTFY